MGRLPLLRTPAEARPVDPRRLPGCRRAYREQRKVEKIGKFVSRQRGQIQAVSLFRAACTWPLAALMGIIGPPAAAFAVQGAAH